MKKLFTTLLLLIGFITYGQNYILQNDVTVRKNYSNYADIVSEKTVINKENPDKMDITYIFNNNEKRIYSFIKTDNGNLCYKYVIISRPDGDEFKKAKKSLDENYIFQEKVKNDNYDKKSTELTDLWKNCYLYKEMYSEMNFYCLWSLYEYEDSYIIIVEFKEI